MQILFCLVQLVFWLAFAEPQLFGRYPESCSGAQKNGIYTIQTRSGDVMSVYCDVTLLGSPWMVIQRRVDEDINFYRNWAAYQHGFGQLNGSFFLGLNNIHALTASQPHQLLVFLEDFQGSKRYAKYSRFFIGNYADSYRLNVSGYSGNAGDALEEHNNMRWSTFDRDNDLHPNKNCAVELTGAWWYSTVHGGFSNLNGLYLGGEYGEDQYGRGITWYTWKGDYYSLKRVHMMIRPNS